jgi:3-oxoadipate enol-lactonase
VPNTTLDGGFKLYFEEHGTGPPVVLLHGLSESLEAWAAQVPALAERYRVITPDIRGHGRSDKPPGPYSVDQFAEDVRGLLDHLGIERAVVGGLSMGGGVAQTLTLRHPRLVRALILVSTSSTFTPFVRERFLRRAEIAEREGMAPLIDGMMAIWFTPERLRAPTPEVEHIRAMTLANDPLAFAAASRANAARDWTERLSEIRCPTLFVGGLDDPADPATAAAVYRERLPDLETHLLPGVSHVLNVEAAATLNALLLAFLDRVVD